MNGELFFNTIVNEILNENIINNKYVFERHGRELIFYGNESNCYIVTNVIDNNQFKQYYDMLSSIFNHDFNELQAIGIFGGDSSSELYAIIKDKVISIKSDNDCDSWIWDKITNKKLTKTR